MTENRTPDDTAPFEDQEPLSPGARNILKVAERLFAERGFDAVSISHIARAADTSKANIFHHFRNKESLYLASIQAAFQRSTAALDAAASEDHEQAVERMRAFFTGYLTNLLKEPGSARLIQRELMEHGEERGKRLAEDVFSDTFSRVVNLVRDAQREGSVRPAVDPALLAFLLMAANIFFFESRSVLKHLPEAAFAGSPESYNEALFDLLANGFQRRSG